MSINSTKIGKSLELIPVDLATILDPVEGLQARDINDGGKLKYYDSATSTWLAVGSGGGASDHNDLDNIQGGDLTERYHLTEDEHDTVQNLIAERHSNAILNDDSTPVHTIGNWVRYKNAGAVPTTGTGGTPDEDFVFARDTSNPSPLSSGFSFRINKLNLFNAQGNGVSLTKDVPLALRGNFIKFSFVKALVGSINSGDFTLHVYDVTNSAMLPAIGPNEVKGANGSDSLLVSIPANCTQVRFIIHCATTSTDLKVFVFEDVSMELAEPVSVPLTMSVEIDLATHPLKGDFTAGKIRVSKVGQSVTISQLSTVTFSSNANPSSDAGLIPEWARPSQNMFMTTYATGTTYVVASRANGAFDFIFRLAGTSNPSALTFTDGATIAYTVPDTTNTTQGLAVNANPPILSVRKVGGSTNGNNAIASWTATAKNIGFDFNASTGIATIPEDGDYLMIINGEWATAAGATFNILLNGLVYAESRTSQSTATIYSSGSKLLVDLKKGDTIGIGTTTGSILTLANISFSLEYKPSSNTMLMATPEAKMRVDGYLGVGSTNLTTIRYDGIRVNNPGSFFTYTASAALGSSYTINVKGRYRITQGVGSSNASRALAGITVNSANPSADVYTLTYANGFRAMAESSGFEVSNTATWSGVLNPGDIVRTQFATTASHLANTAGVYFEIEFLGYVS